MTDPAPLRPDPLPSPESVQLLDHLLDSLFDDFGFWFQRGLQLLDHTPDALLPPAEQRDLRHRLEEALRAVAAPRSLRAACSAPMAVDMEAMAPWHRLMMRVWNLSALLRGAGVSLPEEPRRDQPGL
ncbi:MAG: DUF2605 domain-containing protein [Vulcanococcus sp.]